MKFVTGGENDKIPTTLQKKPGSERRHRAKEENRKENKKCGKADRDE